MAGYSRGTKIGTLIWSIVIGSAVLVLGISILLPSTKRARMDFRHSLESSATTEPTTEPSTQSTTQPHVNVKAAPATQP